MVRPLAPETFVYELRKDRWIDPISAARVWAAATAATHRSHPNRSDLASRIRPTLAVELSARCDAYISFMRGDFDPFCADARVARDRRLVDERITTWLHEAAAPRFRR